MKRYTVRIANWGDPKFDEVLYTDDRNLAIKVEHLLVKLHRILGESSICQSVAVFDNESCIEVSYTRID